MDKKISLKNSKSIIIISLILLFAFLLRAPFVTRGLPYFFDEDEMNHFYLTTTMLKEGRFDPHYYRKPSLHFYLRIPAEVASFVWNVKKRNINNLKEIVVKSPSGLVGGLSGVASHPFLVKASRSVSLCLSLLTIVFIFGILKILTESNLFSFIGALLFSICKDQIFQSCHIGVDPPVMLFCTITIFYALKTLKDFNGKNLFLTSLFSGLAISSKYNAAPIYFLPLFTMLLCKKYSVKNFLNVLFIPIISFFAASPFLLIKYNLFLNEAASEVLHYGVLGHVGAEGSPGISQLIFYLKYFITQNIGVLPFIFALVGVFYLLKTRAGILFLFFPTLYMLLMIFQKVNFTRNMFMILPCVCVLSVYGLFKVFKIDLKNKLSILLLVLFLIEPFYKTIMLEKNEAFLKDSREKVAKFLKENEDKEKNIFVYNKLDFDRNVFNLLNVKRASEKESLKDYYNTGANLVVYPATKKNDYDFAFKIHKNFDKNKQYNSRLNPNPNIVVFESISPLELSNENLKAIATQRRQEVEAKVYNDTLYLFCNNEKEDSCYINSKVTSLINTDEDVKSFSNISFSFKSPWKNQKISLKIDDEIYSVSCSKSWEICFASFKLKKPITDKENAFLIIDKIFSPLKLKLSGDERFLGIILGSNRNLPKKSESFFDFLHLNIGK